MVPGNVSAGTHDPQIHDISGKTMGTTYHIKISHPGKLSRAMLKSRIDQRLDEINHSMSMYQKDSEISKFNTAPGTPTMSISKGFAQVLKQAGNLHELTGGAWDGTVKPLVDLWGFGTGKSPTATPDKAVIEKALALVGFEKLQLSGTLLSKKTAGVTLDLGSIAKGYGVDQVAQLLMDQGFGNVLVEIGGEVVAQGEKRPGHPWNVGIATPDRQMNRQTVYQALPLTDQALATSGDYRNFILLDRQTYPHIIDPTTGYPVNNGVVSASVLSDNCTLADGLATALMVMGHTKGVALVNRMGHTECLIIVKHVDGTFGNYYSDHFPR